MVIFNDAHVICPYCARVMYRGEDVWRHVGDCFDRKQNSERLMREMLDAYGYGR